MTSFHPETPSKCPPRDAEPSSGIYCRFVFNNPPIPEDFLIWILEPVNKCELQERKRKGDCRAFGVSLFAEEGVMRKAKLFQRSLKKRADKRGEGFLGVAQVKLDKDVGVLKQTGRDWAHFDLWPYTHSKLECRVISVKGI